VLLDAAAPFDALGDVAGSARQAERAGLDSLWAGDHLPLGDTPLLDSTLTLAAAVRTLNLDPPGFGLAGNLSLDSRRSRVDTAPRSPVRGRSLPLVASYAVTAAAPRSAGTTSAAVGSGS